MFMLSELMIELKVLLLLIIANGVPILMRNFLHEKWRFPVDGNIRFLDRQPLFGESKTIRGLVSSIIVTSVVAPIFGLSMVQGAIFATCAMTGDLLSSFIKRRLKLKPSSMALGLDQIPESLLPMLVLRGALQLTVIDMANIVLLFMLCELVLSQMLYRLRIRNRPY